MKFKKLKEEFNKKMYTINKFLSKLKIQFANYQLLACGICNSFFKSSVSVSKGKINKFCLFMELAAFEVTFSQNKPSNVNVENEKDVCNSCKSSFTIFEMIRRIMCATASSKTLRNFQTDYLSATSK